MDIYNKIKDHAIESYPNECVGYICEEGYVRLNNESKFPKTSYRLSIDDKILLSGLGIKLHALIHSHTTLNNTPSQKDLQSQRSTGFVFKIIGTDGVNTTDLKEIIYEESNN